MLCYFCRGLDTSRPREHLETTRIGSRNDGFGRHMRNWRNATVGFIFELCAVPDQTPAGADRRHRGCQSAGRRRVSRARTCGQEALGVEPQQVVLGLTESADWCLRFYAAVRPMPIVSVQPDRKLLGATI